MGSQDLQALPVAVAGSRMTPYLMTPGNVATVAYIALMWLFLIAVVGSVLLSRWYRREREDAAQTEAVMDTLGFDHTHAHDYDGFQ